MRKFVGQHNCVWMVSLLIVITFIIATVLSSVRMINTGTSSPAPSTSRSIQLVQPSLQYRAESIDSMKPNQSFKVVNSDIFDNLIAKAVQHPRKRKMIDITKDPEDNSMQTLINTWVNGSYSPVHKHEDYSEVGWYFYIRILFDSVVCTYSLLMGGAFCRDP